MQEQDSAIWVERAARLLERASEELAHDPDDGVIGTASAAYEALRVAWGDIPDAALLDFFRDEEANPDESCTCPSELRERGGWQSTCPAHGSRFSLSHQEQDG